jgi:hypothetical protein
MRSIKIALDVSVRERSWRASSLPSKSGRPMSRMQTFGRLMAARSSASQDGYAVEVGTVGNKGFSGVELLAGATLATETCVCQIEGDSLRMRTSDFREAVKGPSPLRHFAECYLQGYLMQLSQSVACNRKHTLEARFARWMLITHDRVKGQEFYLTQEYLADMLGSQRPSVSMVAAGFQKEGVLQYSRGHVKILNRAKLEGEACECYANIRQQFKRVLGVPYG